MDNIQNKFPVGVSDFRKLLVYRDPKTNARLSVDKSLFIRDIMGSGTEVALFTRPRRFGKTLILSMLEHFFSAEVNGIATSGMFDDLKIAAYQEHMKHQGQYPVIFITFKDAKARDYQNAYKKISRQIMYAYRKHKYLQNSDKLDEIEKNHFYRILSGKADQNEFGEGIKVLSEYLSLHHGKQVIILIDEYDSPIHSAYNNGYYLECIDFMRDILSGALKNNSALQFGVMTGILRVAKESIFSGLNNLGVYSVLSNMHSEYFGFTEEEVNYLIDQTQNSDIDRQKIKDNYNGYRFGRNLIYNPWSIINCLNQEGEINKYWVNTADNKLIQNLVIKADQDVKEIIERMIQGESCREKINDHLIFSDLETDPNSVLMLMLMTGYLTAKNMSKDLEYPITAELLIPNSEIMYLFRDVVQGWIGTSKRRELYNKFLEDLIKGDVESFAVKLQEITNYVVSYFDVGPQSQEKFYHGLMLGIAAGVTNTHEVRSNRESGRGRYDLMIIPKDVKQYPLGIVMEFKFVKDEAQIEEAAQQALTQIESQNYTQELETRGIKHIIKIGIGFAGKKVAVKYTPQK